METRTFGGATHNSCKESGKQNAHKKKFTVDHKPTRTAAVHTPTKEQKWKMESTQATYQHLVHIYKGCHQDNSPVYSTVMCCLKYSTQSFGTQEIAKIK